jgi:hypothetical protein
MIVSRTVTAFDGTEPTEVNVMFVSLIVSGYRKLDLPLDLFLGIVAHAKSARQLVAALDECLDIGQYEAPLSEAYAKSVAKAAGA